MRAYMDEIGHPAFDWVAAIIGLGLGIIAGTVVGLLVAPLGGLHPLEANQLGGCIGWCIGLMRRTVLWHDWPSVAHGALALIPLLAFIGFSHTGNASQWAIYGTIAATAVYKHREKGVLPPRRMPRRRRPRRLQVELETTVPVIGYRQWRVDADGWLWSVHQRCRWNWNELTWSQSRAGIKDFATWPHDAGIYAYHDLQGCRGASSHEASPALLTGLVVGFGDVLVHEEGWRAERVRIIAFIAEGQPFRRRGDGFKAARRYGVPVVDPNALDGRALAAIEQEHGQRTPGRAA